VNKLGDSNKKVQCHAINLLVTVTRSCIADDSSDMATMLLREIGLFLNRPGCKASHRIYALGLLNKIAIILAPRKSDIRSSLLKTYFTLFNKLLHMEPAVKSKVEEPKIKDRKISKNDRIKAEKAARRKVGSVDEEDNKVIELVLKGVNVIMQKCNQNNDDLKEILEEQTNLLFRLSHHKVFKIQLQVLKLLFSFAKASQKFENIAVAAEDDDQEKGSPGNF